MNSKPWHVLAEGCKANDVGGRSHFKKCFYDRGDYMRTLHVQRILNAGSDWSDRDHLDRAGAIVN